jgi:hypothetical protein
MERIGLPPVPGESMHGASKLKVTHRSSRRARSPKHFTDCLRMCCCRSSRPKAAFECLPLELVRKKEKGRASPGFFTGLLGAPFTKMCASSVLVLKTRTCRELGSDDIVFDDMQH